MRLAVPAVVAAALAASCTDSKPRAPAQRDPACRTLQAAATGPGDVEGLFPLVEGDAWFHHVSNDVTSYTVRTVVGAPQQVQGGASAYGRTMRGVDEQTFPSTRFFTNVPGGVVAHASPAAVPPQSLAFPHVAIRWPLVPGEVYETFSCTDLPTRAEMDGDGVPDVYDVVQDVTVGPVEDIEVHFGTVFARKITTSTRYHYRMSGGGEANTEEREDAWYAPGVGRVGSVGRRLGGGLETTVVDLLSGYALGGRREGLQALETLDLAADGAPALAAGPAGTLVAASLASSPGSTYLGAFAVDAAGASPPFPVFDPAGPTAYLPSAAARDDGFLVAAATGEDVRFARFGAAGARLDPLAGVPLAGDGAVSATAAAGGDDGWAVAWNGASGLRFARVGADGAVLGVQPLSSGRARAPAVAWVAGRWLALWVGDDGLLHVRPVAADGAAGAETTAALGDVRGLAVGAGGDDLHLAWIDASRLVRTARLDPAGALLGEPVTVFAGRDVDVVYDLELTFDGARHAVTFSAFSLDGMESGAHAAIVTPAGEVVEIHGETSAMLAPYGEFAAALPADGGESRFLWKRGDRYQVARFAF